MRLDSSFSGHSQPCLQSKEIIKIILHSYCGRCKALILQCESDEFVSAITVENDNLESFSDDSSTDDADDSSMELEVNNPACGSHFVGVCDCGNIWCMFNVAAFNAVKSGFYCESLFCIGHILCATDIAYL
ncbi:hypothetical protein Lser_V15G26195 [Lactuca serriola]